jgi:hypothetical protein
MAWHGELSQYLYDLHSRLIALEKHAPILDIRLPRPGEDIGFFEAPNNYDSLLALYNALKNVEVKGEKGKRWGWKFRRYDPEMDRSVDGWGVRKGRHYEIEVDMFRNMYDIQCTENVSFDDVREPKRKTYTCNTIDEVQKWLDNFFMRPMPALER